MKDSHLLRYSRHILLNEIGIAGQEKINAAHALIVGAGGLGCPAGLYLAAAGVGTITLVDDDRVDLTNLQRQILYTATHLNALKAEAAQENLASINPEIRIQALPQRLEGVLLEQAVISADVVLDCSDNFATRHALNRACVLHHKPLIAGAALGFEGQMSVFDLRLDHQGAQTSPCYDCVFPDNGEANPVDCATMGVFAPLTGIIGTIQAAEALKCIVGMPETLSGRLLLLDARIMAWRSIALEPDPSCPICGC